MGSGIKLAKKYGISPVAVYNMLGKLNVNLIPKEELEEGKQRLGREWEIECLRQLERSKDFSGENWRCAFDISWNDFKINVKASKPVRAGERRDKNAWSFNTKKHEGVDYFLCIGLDEEGELEKMFMVPVDVVKKQTTIRRSGNTKYEKYRTTFEELNQRRESGY